MDNNRNTIISEPIRKETVNIPDPVFKSYYDYPKVSYCKF